MKFAQYLDNTQIPEWKKAYIDFKGLKKRIGAIRKTGQVGKLHPQPSRDTTTVISQDLSPRHLHSPTSDPTPPRGEHVRKRSLASRPLRSGGETVLSHTHSTGSQEVEHKPFFPKSFTTFARRRSTRAPIQLSTTADILPASLDPLESSFFAYLGDELEKVDTFYKDHETEAVAKSSALKDQLRSLQEHRRLFHKAQGTQNESRKNPFRTLRGVLGLPGGYKLGSRNANANEKRNERNDDTNETAQPRLSDEISLDPYEYQHSKRKLKKAYREFYRSLELLNDYRVLNLTGFRKALKKYDKVTGRLTQDLYMREKVLIRRFAFSESMNEIMQEVEDIFATRFEHGDLKKTRRRLKAPSIHKTHHYSAFRSGVFIGLAIPALVSGLHKSFEPETRRRILEWDSLLEIYGALIIPVIFALLVGVNLIAWSRARINFAFIFEVDVSSAIDIHEYFELPALLFATLCYAFWFSFLAIGSQTIAPTTWPVIWIGFALVILLDPFPILLRQSRYWFLGNISRLLVPGITRVDFTDFWMGDQLCSLSYSMAHLFNIVCAYSHAWHNVWDHCGSVQQWQVPYVLLAFPYLVRMVQSIRRYYDSRLPTHLINAGKYLSSVVANLVYYVWRVRDFEGSRYNYVFVIWCLFATLSSVYLTFWDFLMDWSLISSHISHRFLRKELIYSSNPLIYYFAIITNILIRFIWIIYIPSKGLDRRVRTFIAAALEVGRRIQWNFYRLENEQIGNTDQYRATKEVPLPYFGQRSDDHDESDIEGGEQPSNKPTGVYENDGEEHMSKPESQGSQPVEV